MILLEALGAIGRGLADEYKADPFSRYEKTMLALVGLGAALRFYHLGAALLSYDESITALLAAGRLADLIRGTAGDVHPPVFYLLEAAALRLGTWAGLARPLALRLLPAILGTLTTIQVWRLGRRLGLGNAGKLAAVALYALLPFQLHYSQDARMYTALQFVTLAALEAALDRAWRPLGVWLGLALWLHNYGLVYWAVIGAVALALEMRRPVQAAPDPEHGFTWRGPEDSSNLKALGLALGLPLVAWLPWAGVLAWQFVSLARGGYWIPALTAGQALYPFYAIWFSATLPGEVAGFGCLLVFGLMAFAIVKAARLRRHGLLVWLALAPAGLAAGASVIAGQSFYLFRALVGVAVPWYLLVAWAITHDTGRWARAWAVASLAPFVLAGLANRGHLQTLIGPQTIAQDTIAAQARPGDIIYHGNVASMVGFAASGYPDLPAYLLPERPGNVGTLTPATRAALGFCEADLQPGLVLARCGQAAQVGTWRRVWLVWGAVPTIGRAEDEAIANLLAAYPHEQVLDLDTIFAGDDATVDGGVWLLEVGP